LRIASLVSRIFLVCTPLALILVIAAVLGLFLGTTYQSIADVLSAIVTKGRVDSTLATIVWRIRMPRVVLAILTGASLSLGGLVLQALLRNPLAEPYILGISGGSAVGAIAGMLLGFSQLQGVAFFSFAGSMAALLLILAITSGGMVMKKDSLILAGVMVNAFCGSIIIFLISLTQDRRVLNILFWLMGDLSMSSQTQVMVLAVLLIPCTVIIFLFAQPMNLLLMGEEMAGNMGLNVRRTSLVLLMTSSLMVSLTVCCTGLLGFVGLVTPHLLRLLLGPDHRVLVPACIFGGGAYLVFCDLLARILPAQGEMPVGVITAMIGAPLFMFLLWRSKR
jgi:iron complex transport system permease protein